MQISKETKIYVAGHTGLLGSAMVTKLKNDGYTNIITRSREELDLTASAAVDTFFDEERPEIVFLCAGKVGGILDNKTYPANYLHTNLCIQDNVFQSATKYETGHVVFYGSTCTYPKVCDQPIKESDWMTGAIEETSAGYAAAKIAGIYGCKSYNTQYDTNRFICLIPNSMYGANDNFDPSSSHVFSALIRKFYEAKLENKETVTLWGTGSPRREFIYAEDAADASLFAVLNAEKLENSHYNVGMGHDYSIRELAEIISSRIGYEGTIEWDTEKPDGTMQKLLDSSKFLSLGWKPKTSLDEGLDKTVKWFGENYDRL